MNPDGVMMILCGVMLCGIGMGGGWISMNRFQPEVSILITLGFLAVLVLGFWLGAEGVITITKGAAGCAEIRNTFQ